MGYQFAVFYFAAYIAHAVFLAGTAWVATQFRVPIVEAKLGIGPKLFTRGRFTMTLLPSSAFVRMLDSRDNPGAVEDEHAYDRQSRLVRASIALSGPIAMVLAAVVIRGTAGWESFLHGFGQILSGATAPASRGAELVGGYMQVVEEIGLVTALGVFLAKMAAVNLLPIPVMGGGMALLELLGPSPRSSAQEKLWMRAQHIGLVVFLALLLPWLYAIVVAVMAS